MSDLRKRLDEMVRERAYRAGFLGDHPFDVEACLRTVALDLLRQLREREWRPIETAPDETEILVGRWREIGERAPEWVFCKSARYFDTGNPWEGEPAYWFWAEDHDTEDVTYGEGPTHWMPLPAPPNKEDDHA